MIDLDLIEKLNLLFDRAPFSITRMISTPMRNRQVGGSAHSWHLDLSCDPAYARPCGAADLVFDGAEEMHKAVPYAQALGFGGIEMDLTNNHLHLDVRPMDKKWWVVKTDQGESPLPPMTPTSQV